MGVWRMAIGLFAGFVISIGCTDEQSELWFGSVTGAGADVECACSTGTRGDTGLVWVSLVGGTYSMGSDSVLAGEGGSSDGVHDVTLAGFEIAKTETTVAEYMQCVDACCCDAAETGGACTWDTGATDHPVNCVTWSEAGAFCEWAGARLCSEAEWEYAARSQGKAYEYPWGNESPTCDVAILDDGGYGCGKAGPWEACSKPAGNTEQDLCDLAGNVWEWVADCCHGDYSGAPSDGRAWTWDCRYSGRIKRGGSWNNNAENCLHASYRGDGVPSSPDIYVGFRCCRSVD
jgi:formylglycine-generating enzyme